MGSEPSVVTTSSEPKPAKKQAKKGNSGASAQKPPPEIYWLYRWRAAEVVETYGPFDGSTMSAWQMDNMFCANPADACRCSANGVASDDQWYAADQVDFMIGAKPGLGE